MYFMKPSSHYVGAVHNGPFGPLEKDASSQMQQLNEPSPDEFITLQIWLYVTPVLLLTGTLGSLASISVLLRPNIRKSTPMYFLTLLSLTDAVVLWLGLFRLYISQVYDYDVRDASNLSCKLHTVFVYFTLDLGSWLLALIAIERFLFIVCPHTAKLQWNRTKGTYAVIAVAIVLILVNGHYIFTTYLKSPRSVPGNVTWVTNDSLVANTSISIGNEVVSNITDSINLTEETYNDSYTGKDVTAPISFWFNVSKTDTASYNQFNDSYVRIKVYNDVPRCANRPWSNHFHNVIFPWVDFVAFFFLPFCIMVITHVGIIRHVHLVNARLRKTPQTAENLGRKGSGYPTPKTPQCICTDGRTVQCTSTDGRTKTTDTAIDIDEANSTLDVPNDRKKRKGTKSKKAQRSKVAGVSLMLVSVLVTFAITTCPITFYVIMTLFQDPENQTPEETGHQNLHWVIVNMIQYTNNASHFFSFILTSKNFRQELLKMFAEFCSSCKRLRNACIKRSNIIEPRSS